MTAITSDHINALAKCEAMGIGSPGNQVFPLNALRDWQIDAMKKIAGLSALQSNWDSYGSPGVADEVLDAARDMVVSARIAGPVPRIIPVSGGGLQMSWEAGARELEVELMADLSVGVLASQVGSTDVEFQSDSYRNIPLARLLHWVRAGGQ